METLLYISAVNVIVLYCLCHKWSDYSREFCMFCTFFWVSFIETFVMSAYGFIYQGESIEFWHTIGKVMFLTVLTNVGYFYVKHLHE